MEETSADGIGNMKRPNVFVKGKARDDKKCLCRKLTVSEHHICIIQIKYPVHSEILKIFQAVELFEKVPYTLSVSFKLLRQGTGTTTLSRWL